MGKGGGETAPGPVHLEQDIGLAFINRSLAGCTLYPSPYFECMGLICFQGKREGEQQERVQDRGPKISVPRRTIVAPSSTATR